MKNDFLLAALVAIGGCAMVDTAPTPRQQNELAAELGNRVPGPQLACLPSYRTSNMVRAGGRILYGSGSQLYLAQTSPGCEAIDGVGNVLLIELHGTTDLCSGELLKVIDTRGQFLRGSCTLEGFTPYRRP